MEGITGVNTLHTFCVVANRRGGGHGNGQLLPEVVRVLL